MPGTASARTCPRTSSSTPALGIGSIITPAAAASRASPSSGQAERVAEHELLERHAEPEAQRARTEPAYGPGRELEHDDASVRPDAQLGVHRTLAQAPGRRRRRRRPRRTASSVFAGSRDGVTKMVSSK